jgi:pyruvate kinase
MVLGKDTTEPDTLALPHKEIFDALMPGHHLLIDDGKVRVKVVRMIDQGVEVEVINGGPVTDRKGVNLPDTLLDLSTITEKDRADLAFGLELGVDWVAFSFVQRPADLIEAHGLVGGRAGVMAKIEKPSALKHFDELVRLADAIMVARGDLGVEIPPEDVPGAQKDLVRLDRILPRGRFSRQHHRIRPVINGGGDIGGFGAGRRGRADHRFQHLGGDNDRLARHAAGPHQVFLRQYFVRHDIPGIEE